MKVEHEADSCKVIEAVGLESAGQRVPVVGKVEQGVLDGEPGPYLGELVLHYREGEPVGHGKGAKPYLARLFCHTATREEADALTAELFEAFSVKGRDGAELSCRESLPFMENDGERPVR